MESDTVKASVVVERKREANKHAWEDFLYLMMGEATPGNAVMLILALIFFGMAPVLLMLFFANYSGGFRWLLTLAIVTFLGLVAVYLMKRGTRVRKASLEKVEVQTEFPGQLTEVTEAVDRGGAGYVYSQQMLRERLCEDIIDKVALLRDLSRDEIITMLEKGKTDFIGDELIAKFLLRNRRGSKGWEETQFAGKGKSAERGQKFMVEIELILDGIEEIL